MEFYNELGMYWKRDLIDKDIIVYHLKDAIIDACKSIEKKEGDNRLLYPDIIEMNDDIVNMHSLDYKLQKLYVKMNIR